MVSGALALAMQKWPEADSNQLIRSMLDTAKKTKGDNMFDEEIRVTLDALKFVHNDPSSYELTSPIMGKAGGVSAPDEEMIQEYLAGLGDPRFVLNDNDYVYRGTDPEMLEQLPEGMRSEPGTAPGMEVSPTVKPSEAPTQPPSVTPVAVPESGVPVVWIVAGIVSVVLVALVIVVVLRRSKGQHLS
jgi:hypothetical protein